MGTEALILHELGDDEAALSLSERVCRVIGEAYGPNSANVAHVQSNHAEYLLAVGRSEEALQLFEDARVRWERHVGPDHQFLAYPLTGTGRALLALGRAKEAVAPLQRALRIREVHDPDPVERGETRFALAQALWAVGDHHRARATALAAREEYAQAPAGKHLAETVAAWLSSHGSG
jgi:tetratricopeptide (TPR) repeat protein